MIKNLIYNLYDTKDNDLPVAVGTLHEISDSTGIPYRTLITRKCLGGKIHARYLLEKLDDIED